MVSDAAIKVELAAEWTGKKAFSQADKATAALTRNVKNLAGAMGLTFGAATMGRYAKDAVKAFAADEKAAKSLALQLKNTGNAFAAPAVEKYIANLQRTTGILDDELRPAFQTLLTATGDVATAQQILAVALDVAAGTGKNLGAVTAALSKGFLGQTGALSKLGVKLDKATLASGDMNKIMDILTKTYKGQALEATKGYAGQIALLTVAASDAKEVIGKSLLDAIVKLSGNNGLGNATTAMTQFGDATAYVIDQVARVVSIIPKATAGITKFYEETLKIMDNPVTNALAFLLVTGAGGNFNPTGPTKSQKAAQKGYGSSNTVENFLAMGGVIKKNTVAFKDNTVVVKAKTELDKLAAKFDLERINLYAALANATTEEEKARIRAKIAIVEQNEAAAKSLNTLSQAAYGAAAAFTRYAGNAPVVVGEGPYKTEVPGGFLQPTFTASGGSMPSTNIPANMASGSAEVFNALSGTYMPQGMSNQFVTNLTVTAGTITNEAGVYDVVQQAMQEINARGWSQFKSGALQAL